MILLVDPEHVGTDLKNIFFGKNEKSREEVAFAESQTQMLMRHL